ncbi:uncharacterized protein LOC144640211 [Oculina patagonica]
MEKKETINDDAQRERSRKRLREAGSQTDEEAGYDSDQNGDRIEPLKSSQEWQDDITKKINKLLKIFPLFEDFKEELKSLKEENDKLRKLVKATDNEVKTLKTTQDTFANDLLNIQDQLNKANLDLEEQKRRNIKLEAQSRRSNIKFFNVPESETDGSNKETEKVLKSLLRNELKISKEAVDNLEFERVHRIPTRRNTLTDQADANKPRPIIAKMSFFKDKGRIFQHVKNINTALKIGVADDFPKEIEDMRKELLPVLKKAKKQNKRASFNVDKLIIDGHIYRGPETKKLPLYANILST